MSLPVAIVGGGSFGVGLARTASRLGRTVILWSRRQQAIEDSKIRTTTDLADLAAAELVFMAAPSGVMRELATELGGHLDGAHLLVHVSRGLLGDGLVTLTQMLRETTPVRRVGALAGPLVAKGLLDGDPSGGVVGTLFPEVADAVRGAISGQTLRIYSTDDVVGVELASALMGLVALAIGYAQGAGFGAGTLAVLATRGVAEAARVAAHRGADERTFSGLAGYGDLLALVAGDERPEVVLGRALAEGKPMAEAVSQAGGYVEGVSIAAQVTAYADRHRLEAPIARGMAKLVAGELTREQVGAELMSRPMKRE